MTTLPAIIVSARQPCIAVVPIDGGVNFPFECQHDLNFAAGGETKVVEHVEVARSRQRDGERGVRLAIEGKP